MQTTGARVLVVEDDPMIAEVLALILGEEGHEVDVAENGAQALRRLDERSYDVIFSDLRMPELDGRAFYDELARSRPELLRRLVFLTGSACDPVHEQFLEASACTVLVKPFNLEDVCRATRSALESPLPRGRPEP
jgi:CheY-like chemotaxis protein